VLWLQACASPAERLLQQGTDFGYARRSLSGNGFQLETFFQAGRASTKVLHVYLEGDGSPWASFNRISDDPTPRQPLMLGLMRQDSSPALYLGRPCYNGHAADTGCTPWLWTFGRYAPTVVDAMATALTAFLQQHTYTGVVFLGHSGGGTLALLLARHFPTTQAVVTIVGNTDIQRWADYHHYSRLQGSLNPADFTDNGFPEWHYLAENDRVIPPALFRPVLAQRRNAQVITVTGFTHLCCWDALWPKILTQVP
jgi:hypothetical protein